MEGIKPFEFKQCNNLVKSTGVKVCSLRELRDAISDVTSESIFHHTYQYFLKGHNLEYTNDFAQWVGESLEERALAEHLSNIDPYDFHDISGLRKELLREIDEYLERFPEPRKAMPGGEFYFNQTVTFVFPVGIMVKNLAEFLIAIKYADIACIYYHFYEARVRLGVDDFSRWIEEMLGRKELARELRSIDPFMHTIDGIRTHIVEAVEAAVKMDMEVVEEQGA